MFVIFDDMHTFTNVSLNFIGCEEVAVEIEPDVVDEHLLACGPVLVVGQQTAVLVRIGIVWFARIPVTSVAAGEGHCTPVSPHPFTFCNGTTIKVIDRARL